MLTLLGDRYIQSGEKLKQYKVKLKAQLPFSKLIWIFDFEIFLGPYFT